MEKVVAKHFSRLTADELFRIYKARVSVFVVEQTCPYQEVDDDDIASTHVWIEENDQLAAYLRIIPKETGVVKIGRVLSLTRGTGLGAKIIRAGIDTATKQMGAHTIHIEAQTYAKGFYEKAGFVVNGEEFLEDGIPHVPMILKF